MRPATRRMRPWSREDTGSSMMSPCLLPLVAASARKQASAKARCSPSLRTFAFGTPLADFKSTPKRLWPSSLRSFISKGICDKSSALISASMPCLSPFIIRLRRSVVICREIPIVETSSQHFFSFPMACRSSKRCRMVASSSVSFLRSRSLSNFARSLARALSSAAALSNSAASSSRAVMSVAIFSESPPSRAGTPSKPPSSVAAFASASRRLIARSQ